MEVLFISILVITFFCPAYTGNPCSPIDLMVCLKPISQFWQVEGVELKDTQFALFHLTVQKVERYCSLFNKQSNGCLSNITAQCTGDEKAMAAGIQQANSFMCGAGVKEFLEHKGCLGQIQTRDALNLCKEKFDQGFGNNTIEMSPKQVANILCRLLEEALECQKTSVLGVCGQKAMGWFVAYKRLMSGPSEEKYHCYKDQRKLYVSDISAQATKKQNKSTALQD